MMAHRADMFLSSLIIYMFIIGTGNINNDGGDDRLSMIACSNADASDNIVAKNKYEVRPSARCGQNLFPNDVISGSAK